MKHYSISSLGYGKGAEVDAGFTVVPRLQSRLDGSRGAVLQVALHDHPPVDLPDAVDTSGGPNDLAVHLALTDDARTIFVIGGHAAYRWEVTKDPERIDILRDPRHEEYWDTSMINVGATLLVVYEAGVMLLGDDLHVHWHQPKLYNDIYIETMGDKVWFEGDSGERWALALADGCKLES